MKVFDILKSGKYKNKKVLEKLLQYHLNFTKEQLIKNYDINLESEIVDKIEKDYFDFERNKKPLEYIFWYVEFFGDKFFVDERVLIPRPETEYMIEAIKEFWKNLIVDKINLIDIGTWCGVLGISAFKILSKQDVIVDQIVLTDISKDALDVAKINVDNLIEKKDQFKFKLIQSDLLSSIDDSVFHLPTILIANLPYIPNKIFEENVEENVKKREPSIAFLGGEDGLDLYRKMLNQIVEKDLRNIIMFLEMMDWQANKLSQFYPQFNFEKIKTFHFNIKIVKAERV